MSNALARLREGVGDPLFERTRHGIDPTARALALAEPVRSAMNLLQQALGVESAPSPAPRVISIAANAYAQALVLPHLTKTIRDAPRPIGIDVRFNNLEGVDLTIEWTGAGLKAGGSRSATLLRDEFVGIVRRGRREMSTRYTLADFLEVDHVAIGPDRVHDPVDVALATLEKRRRIVACAPDFTGAAWIVSGSDLVAVLPRKLAERLAAGLALRVLKPPIELKELVLAVSWSARGSADSLVMWVKNRLLEAAKP